MELSHISKNIIKIIDARYDDFDEESLDIIQIKNICNLYKIKSVNSASIELTDINFSSPEFKKITTKCHKKTQSDILKSKEFAKKYSFFIKILYACLKIDVEIFTISDTTITLKNNYHLIKSLEAIKKKIISEHLEILRDQYKNIARKLEPNYENYVRNYLTKIKIIDKISASINKLIRNNIFDRTDNLLTLILPYFYTYAEFIEEYN